MEKPVLCTSAVDFVNFPIFLFSKRLIGPDARRQRYQTRPLAASEPL